MKAFGDMGQVRRSIGEAARAGLLALCLVFAGPGCATALAPPAGEAVSAVPVPGQAAGRQDPGDRATRAKQLFIRGLTQARLDDHRTAVTLFEEALRLAPNNAALLSAIAESKDALGDVTAAIFYADQARRQDAGNVYYHRQIAQYHLSTGDTRRAADAYEALLRQFPGDADALYGLARVYTVVGRYAEAIDAYARLMERHGEDSELLTEILQLYVRQGDEAGMEQTLAQLIAQDPAEHSYRRMLGELYRQQGRLDEAVGVYESALELNAEDLDAALALAELYRERGDDEGAGALVEEALPADGTSLPRLVARATSLYNQSENDPDAASAAVQVLERVLAEAPEQPEALLMLGDLRGRAGDHAGAADLFYRVLRQNPRDPLLWHQAAAAFLQAGDARRAADVAEEGLLLFPGQLPLLRIAGYALMDANRNAAAVARFEEAAEVLAEDAPDDRAQRADVLAALGLLYARQQNLVASDSAYARALAANPDQHLVLNNYAYSLAERGIELQKALAMAQRAVSLRPNEASYFDTLGWVHFKLDNLQEAREWIAKAVATGRVSGAVYDHYGDVLLRMGDPAEARRQWQRALELLPGNASLQKKLEQASH